MWYIGHRKPLDKVTNLLHIMSNSDMAQFKEECVADRKPETRILLRQLVAQIMC